MTEKNLAVFQDFSENDPSEPVAYLENIQKLLNINNATGNPSVHSKGANTGNHCIVKDLMTLEYHTIRSVINSNIHGDLRALYGEMGKKLDKKSLPETLQQYMAELKPLEDEYEAALSPAVTLYEKLFGTEEEPKLPSGCPMYDNRKEMDEKFEKYDKWIQMNPEDKAVYLESKEAANKVDGKVKVLIGKMTEEFDKVSSFHLKGQDEVIPNTRSAQIGNFCMWLYFAEKAAGNYLNTMVVPHSLAVAMNNSLDKQKKMVQRLCGHLDLRNEARQPVLMQPIDHILKKINYSIVKSGSYEDLCEDEGSAKILQAASMDKEKYDEIALHLQLMPKIINQCPHLQMMMNGPK